MVDQLDNVADSLVLTMSDGETLAVDETMVRLMHERNGSWVVATDANDEGTSTFVVGGWRKEFGRGTYGLDAAANLLWDVVDRNGKFTVSAMPEPSAWALTLGGPVVELTVNSAGFGRIVPAPGSPGEFRCAIELSSAPRPRRPLRAGKPR